MRSIRARRASSSRLVAANRLSLVWYAGCAIVPLMTEGKDSRVVFLLILLVLLCSGREAGGLLVDVSMNEALVPLVDVSMNEALVAPLGTPAAAKKS